MKPIFFAILIFSTLALGCVNYKVKSLYASVRDGPSKSAKLKSVSSIGQKLCIVEITNDFAKINSGLYVKADSIMPVDKTQTAPSAKPAKMVSLATSKTLKTLKTLKPPKKPTTPPCKTMYVNITSGTLNTRTGPGTTFAASGSLAKGAAVCVVSTANGWSKLDNGKYVSATLITATKPDPQNTGTSSTSTNSSSGNDKVIWDFLKGKGLNDFAVAGLMGNLDAESGLRSNNLEDSYEKELEHTDASYTKAVDDGSYTEFVSDSAGYGLAQWTFSARKANLLAFAKSSNVSISDLNMQLNFLWKELNSDFKSVVKTLQSAKSVSEASNVVLLKFEIPKDQSAAVQEERTKKGMVYYNKYAGKSSTTNTSSGGSTSTGTSASTSASTGTNTLAPSSGGSTNASPDSSSWNCKYFTFKELIHSDTAKEKGIDNEPKNPEHIANLKLLCEKILDPLRVKWGGPITVNSGFRSQALNNVLPGASKTSQHMTGQAADLHTSDNKRLFEMIKTSDLPYDQLINENNYGWIHVSYGPENRRQVLAIP